MLNRLLHANSMCIRVSFLVHERAHEQERRLIGYAKIADIRA